MIEPVTRLEEWLHALMSHIYLTVLFLKKKCFHSTWNMKLDFCIEVLISFILLKLLDELLDLLTSLLESL